jgi:phytoene dehydrogenase-like protein
VIIGSGVGGMCAAAGLTARGLRVLVLEKSPHLGGRCSHRLRDGCTVTTGAIMIPMGSANALRQAFDAVGAPMDMTETTGSMRYRLPHGDYDTPKGGGGLKGMIEFALQGDEAGARQLFGQFREAFAAHETLDRLSFRAWLDLHTTSDDVRNVFQGFCAALMGTSLHEIPAGEFFRFLNYMSRGSRYGLATHGNGALMQSLAEAIEARGAVIRRRARCERIVVEDIRATGVIVRDEAGREEQVAAEYVISNTGPVRTIELAGGEAPFAGEYLSRLQAMPYEAPIIHLSFITDEPLIEGFTGSLVFGNTTNLIYLEIPSLISPALAPPGSYLHTAYGAPRDAARPDLEAEMKNTLRELEENFPGTLARARFLVRARHSGQAPGMHRWPGYMMPVDTPVAGLFNVGDGCTPPGTIGTEGSAASARAVVERITRTA